MSQVCNLGDGLKFMMKQINQASKKKKERKLDFPSYWFFFKELWGGNIFKSSCNMYIISDSDVRL